VIREGKNRNGVTISAVILKVIILIAVFYPMLISRRHGIYRDSQCMVNLHDIAIAAKMYQQDYKAFPESLAGYVEMDAGKVVPLKQVKNGNGLYPVYIRTPKGYHCPHSPVEQMDSVAEIKINGKVRRYYTYSSYDVYVPREPRGVVKIGPNSLRYNPALAGDKNLKDDTIITWCSNHGRDRVLVLFLDGHVDKIPAASVEGTNGSIGSRWSTRPKR